MMLLDSFIKTGALGLLCTFIQTPLNGIGQAGGKSPDASPDVADGSERAMPGRIGCDVHVIIKPGHRLFRQIGQKNQPDANAVRLIALDEIGDSPFLHGAGHKP